MTKLHTVSAVSAVGVRHSRVRLSRLTVVAVLLATVVVVVACAQRMPEIASLFQPIDPETGISMLAY